MAAEADKDDDDEKASLQENTIRVVKYDGKKKEDFREWSMKFQALANKKGFKEAITTQLDVGDGSGTALDKKQKANKKLNAIAWEFMILSTTGTAFLHVAGAKGENPNDAWLRLRRVYEPRDMAAIVKYIEDFARMMLIDPEQPCLFIGRLEVINTNMMIIDSKYEKTDIEMTAAILTKLPATYNTCVTAIKLQGISTFDVMSLTAHLDEFHGRVIVGEHGTKKSGGSFANYAQNKGHKSGTFGKKFKGTCRHCGKQGHKEVDCYAKKREEGNGGGNQSNNTQGGGRDNSNIKCYRCNKMGHYARDCSEKKEKAEEALFVGCTVVDDDSHFWMPALAHRDEESDDDSSCASMPGLGLRGDSSDSDSDEEEEYGDDSFWDVENEEEVATVGNFNSYYALAEEEESAIEEEVEESTIEKVEEEEWKIVSNKGSNIENWLVDTGATCDVTNNKLGMVNMKKISETIRVGTGDKTVATISGDVYLVDYKSGSIMKRCGVYYVPTFTQNILSVGKLMDSGVKVGFDKNAMMLTSKGKEIICPRNPKNKMFYLQAKRKEMEVNANENVTVEPTEKEATKSAKPKSVDINEAHELMGHKCERLVKKTYKYLATELTGKFEPCEACGLAKAKAKGVPKAPATKAEKPGERWCVDTSGPFTETVGGNKFWVQMVDEATSFGINHFVDKKSKLAGKVETSLETLKNKSYEIES
jgi:hypothetical protein